MNTEKSIDIINSLIEINNDRMEGYETAANETTDADLKSLFDQLKQTSEHCKRELVNEVKQLGGTPFEGTKTTGKLFRVWMDLKAAITNKDHHAILSSCEFGEDVAVDTYQEVIENDSNQITARQLTIIGNQLSLIKSDHEKIRSLRDMANADR